MSWWLVVLVWYVAWTAVGFGLMWLDKRRAGRGGWRIKERTLHSVGLFGGWMGILVGSEAFRHKRRKRGFMVIAWLVAMVHIAGWGAAAWFWLGW